MWDYKTAQGVNKNLELSIQNEKNNLKIKFLTPELLKDFKNL